MKVAVLGAGRMGSLRARILSETPEVDEIVIGNRSVERAKRLADEIDGSAGTIEQVIDPNLDVIIISLSSGVHAEVLSRCIEAKVPILCEKPIALTLPETEEVIEQAQEHEVMLQVAFQRRFDPDYVKAWREIKERNLGTLYNIRMVAHDAEPSPESYIPGSGGMFRDLHVHDFDLARWLTGLEIERVYAAGNVRRFDQYAKYGDLDSSAILLNMSDGLPVVITGTRQSPRGHDFRMEVFGSEDNISVGTVGPVVPRPVEPDATVPDEPIYRDFLERFEEAFRQETAAFLAAARGEISNPCPGTAAMEALRVAIGCEQSRESGQPVRVADVQHEPTSRSKASR